MSTKISIPRWAAPVLGPSGPLALCFILAAAPLSNAGWSSNNPLNFARYGHTSTLLPNGKVLVAGGYGTNGVLSSAELYDPASGAWGISGSFAGARMYHKATLLPNGKVLVSGGYGISSSLASCEIYNPATGSWTLTGSMHQARNGHTATLMSDGRVLVAGGVLGAYPNDTFLSSAEVYDPNTESWTITAPLATARGNHTSTLLPDGRVLTAGGEAANPVFGRGAMSGAEAYVPTSGTWNPVTPMTVARREHTATLLADGRVLVVGGVQAGGGLSTITAEIFVPGAERWVSGGTSLRVHYDHTATLLQDGRVLVAGGNTLGGDGRPLAVAEAWNGISGRWTAVSNLITARWAHTASLLQNGDLLLAGGIGPDFSLTSTSERYHGPCLPIVLTQMAKLPGGVFQLQFTNSPGELFTVLAASNLMSAAPVVWESLGTATEIAPGQFRFNDSQAINRPQRFYVIRFP